MQYRFNPIDTKYFNWIEDGHWYDFDHRAAHKEALKRRNKEAKDLVKQGRKVVKWTLRDQLVRRGGIGTGHPDVEFMVNVYMLNVLE